mmetsp:Transcript_172916/g.554462  ORF Transcript_172916/g.554462 Transcript_172916/m.554462 type:complete len:201 (+) Transcript_172916:2248-2850(+)
MQRRVEGILVRLHDVDLRAGLAAHVVRIAIVVEAFRLPRVLVHGRQVKGSVAAAVGCRNIHCEGHLLPQQVEGQVVGVVVHPGALVGEVGPALHVRDDLALALDQHICALGASGSCLPTGRNNSDVSIAWHVEAARTSVGGPALRRPRARGDEAEGGCCAREEPLGSVWHRHHPTVLPQRQRAQVSGGGAQRRNLPPLPA